MNDDELAGTRREVNRCPVCDNPLTVTEMTCGSCQTRLVGKFELPPLARLPPDQQRFVETFLRCRGIIRDVERELGISYPTVRARLDAVVEAMEELRHATPPQTTQRDARRRALLARVEEGTLAPEDAAALLRHL